MRHLYGRGKNTFGRGKLKSPIRHSNPSNQKQRSYFITLQSLEKKHNGGWRKTEKKGAKKRRAERVRNYSEIRNDPKVRGDPLRVVVSDQWVVDALRNE